MVSLEFTCGNSSATCRLDEIFADFARHLADLAEFGSLGRWICLLPWWWATIKSGLVGTCPSCLLRFGWANLQEPVSCHLSPRFAQLLENRGLGIGIPWMPQCPTNGSLPSTHQYPQRNWCPTQGHQSRLTKNARRVISRSGVVERCREEKDQGVGTSRLASRRLLLQYGCQCLSTLDLTSADHRAGKSRVGELHAMLQQGVAARRATGMS